MHLIIEDINDFFRMFDGKEWETIVFVGQMNYATKETMSVDVVMSTRYVEEGEVTIIEYKESIGVAELPNPMFNRPETKDVYDKQVADLGNLDTLAEAKKTEMIKLFKEKKFTVYRGIWTDGN